ncbi:MAG: glycoside hydrolase family 1 [Opitutales bacterium]|nr:glycoside hydrolase family 1 [Opitutales bacterium]
MPGFLKKLSSLFPQSSTPRIEVAYWRTNSTILVSLDKDWKNSWKMPPFALKSGSKISSVSRIPPIFWSAISGYYFDEENVVFILHPSIYRDYYLPIDSVIYVAGTFNDWNPAGASAWKMTYHSFGQFGAWAVRVPRNRLFDGGQKTKEFFKFITADGKWIEPPAGTFTLADDGCGNRNLCLDSERTGWNAFRIVCEKAMDVTRQEEVVWTSPKEQLHSVPVKTGYFLSLIYSDARLGATVSRSGRATAFRLFAPRAMRVSVHVRASGNAPAISRELKPILNGVWETEIPENLHGRHYDFFVEGRNSDTTTAFEPNRPILDPYAKACVSCEGPGIVIDEHRFGFPAKKFTPPHLSDLVISEVHLRDLIARHPKFRNLKRPLGFRDLAEWVRSDDCYLKKLGVNAVELQPIQQFDSKKAEDYHWGYMTTNWFSPSSAYASDPARATQTEEFRDLVAAFHEQGFTVILDVMYNHVGEPNHLFRIDKNYYFDLDFHGNFTNWSGCGNDYRADRPMSKRLVIDSLLWMIERYGVDGFRFDLAELIGIPALRGIESAVRERHPDCILIAEPWSFRGHIAGALKSTSYSSWNDGYRDYAAKFVHNCVNLDGFRYFISGSPDYLATFPAQTVNYTESHDDRCWLDRITECGNGNAANPTWNDRRRTHLMFAFLLSSLGVPMIAEGQDFLRTKHGKNNTYLDGEENALDYARMKKFAGTQSFVANWIRFRLSPQGRLFRQRANVPKGFLRFFPDQTNTAAVVIYNDSHVQGKLQYILTINPRTVPAQVQIPSERFSGFRCIANTEAFDIDGVPAEDGFSLIANMLTLPPLSCSLWVNGD